jgi:hypothetical protein
MFLAVWYNDWYVLFHDSPNSLVLVILTGRSPKIISRLVYESIIIKYPGFSQRFILHRFIDANPDPDIESVSHKLMIVYNFVLCIYSIITFT